MNVFIWYKLDMENDDVIDGILHTDIRTGIQEKPECEIVPRIRKERQKGRKKKIHNKYETSEHRQHTALQINKYIYNNRIYSTNLLRLCAACHLDSRLHEKTHN